eukprot:scaffold48381_cov62-Phaeocystis_antarctica.AAC.8
MLASLVAVHSALTQPLGLRRASAPQPLRCRSLRCSASELQASLLAEVPPWRCPSSAPVPLPGGSGQLDRKRLAHGAPSHCLGCLS